MQQTGKVATSAVEAGHLTMSETVPSTGSWEDSTASESALQ